MPRPRWSPCNELWQTGLSTAELAEIGARVGSDVPFSLAVGPRSAWAGASG